MSRFSRKSSRAKRSGLLIAALMLSMAFCLLSSGLVLAQGDGWNSGEVVTIQELVDHMEEFNDRVVTVEGEVVGDVMRRGENAWITVNDDAYSEMTLDEGQGFTGYSNVGIGVWVSAAAADSIEFCGGYKVRGDRFVVTGVFHRACPEHGGDTDIHATSLRLAERGHEISHPFDYTMLLVALGLLAVSLFLWFLLRRKVRAARQRERGTYHTD
jgi:hypothetical protein